MSTIEHDWASQMIEASERPSPRVTFFGGMRLGTKTRTWTVERLRGAMLCLSSGVEIAAWRCEDVIQFIAAGSITIEPTVGMRVENSAGVTGCVASVSDDGVHVVHDIGGSTSAPRCAFDRLVRTGAWTILAPKPVPSLPPDVDPEATWDGEEDDSCDQKVRADQLAAALKREAEENVWLRSDLDDERFRANALQEELEKTKAERDAARACRQAADTECRATMEDLGRANTHIADLEAKLEEEQDRASACVNGGLAAVSDGDLVREIRRRLPYGYVITLPGAVVELDIAVATLVAEALHAERVTEGA